MANKKRPNGRWQNLENRINAVKELVKKTGKKPNDISVNDFREYGLRGLVTGVYGGSPFLALKEAGLVDFEPWEMKGGAYNGYWKESAENRIRAIKWLVLRIGKDPKKITQKDFGKNCLGGLLSNLYHGSPYLALKEAGLVSQPWEMKGGVKDGYWKEKANRVSATKLLVERTGKEPKKITQNDFYANCLGGLMHFYDCSPYRALKEAGLVNFEPWEMEGGAPQGYWKESVENRIRAIKWLVLRTGKQPKNMCVKDFAENGLVGLLTNFYNSSPYPALKEAGLVDFEPWQMKSRVPVGYWRESENRIHATKWLVEKTGKEPKEITKDDFTKNRLLGLINQYDCSPYLALKAAGYEVKPRQKSANAAELLKLYIRK